MVPCDWRGRQLYGNVLLTFLLILWLCFFFVLSDLLNALVKGCAVSFPSVFCASLPVRLEGVSLLPANSGGVVEARPLSLSPLAPFSLSDTVTALAAGGAGS